MTSQTSFLHVLNPVSHATRSNAGCAWDTAAGSRMVDDSSGDELGTLEVRIFDVNADTVDWLLATITHTSNEMNFMVLMMMMMIQMM